MPGWQPPKSTVSLHFNAPDSGSTFSASPLMLFLALQAEDGGWDEESDTYERFRSVDEIFAQPICTITSLPWICIDATERTSLLMTHISLANFHLKMPDCPNHKWNTISCKASHYLKLQISSLASERMPPPISPLLVDYYCTQKESK